MARDEGCYTLADTADTKRVPCPRTIPEATTAWGPLVWDLDDTLDDHWDDALPGFADPSDTTPIAAAPTVFDVTPDDELSVTQSVIIEIPPADTAPLPLPDPSEKPTLRHRIRALFSLSENSAP